MKKSSLLLTLPVALSLALAGCKKKEEAPAAKPTTTAGSGSGSAAKPATGSGSATAGSATAGSAAAGSGSAAAAPDAAADFFKVVIEHKDATKGPVDVVFAGVKIVKADFDPAKVEGGTATIELDLNTLSSGIAKRDGHLKTADYLDTTKFPTATIDIANVKKGADGKFTADAKIKLRDVEKTYAVGFEVVETLADGIKIKGEHKFSRLDFGVGKAADDANESAVADLVAKLQLTLKKT